MLNEQLPKQPRKLRRLNRQMNREIEFVSECVVEQYLEGTSPTYTVTAKMPKSPFGIDEYLSRVGHTATTLINGGRGENFVEFDHKTSVGLSTETAAQLLFRSVLPRDELISPRILSQ